MDAVDKVYINNENKYEYFDTGYLQKDIVKSTYTVNEYTNNLSQ